MAPQPVTTSLPVQLSAPEVTAFLLPHLSMPKRGPQCTRGSSRVFNFIRWVLYTGMQWKCLPIPQDANGTPAIPSTTVDTVFARWADAGALGRACGASVRHLAAEKPLALSLLHGDGPNTVAKKGAMGWLARGTNTSRASRSWRSSTIMARCELPPPWLPSMRPPWGWCRRASQR